MNDLIKTLKNVFGQLPVLQPNSAQYRELCALLGSLSYRELKVVRDAQIKHASALAARLMSARQPDAEKFVGDSTGGSGGAGVDTSSDRGSGQHRGQKRRKGWTYLMRGAGQ